jgi:hypothetical protein
MQRFSRVHGNIPDIHPAAVIAAFQSNMHNRMIRSKMNVRLPKTVNELYTLVDKCAEVEEGRRLLGEEDGVTLTQRTTMMSPTRRRRMRSATRSARIKQ